MSSVRLRRFFPVMAGLPVALMVDELLSEN
jgi:hypothetical protein